MQFTMENIQWVNQSGRQATVKGGYGAYITVQKNGKGAEGKSRVCNCITISEEVMENARLRKSDRVMIGVAKHEGKEYLLVKRSSEGHAISLTNKGDSSNGYVKFAYSIDGLEDLPFPKKIAVKQKNVEYDFDGFYGEIEYV